MEAVREVCGGGEPRWQRVRGLTGNGPSGCHHYRTGPELVWILNQIDPAQY